MSLDRVVPAVLALALAALPMAPVEHVHRTTDEDGHHHVLAHSHTEAHHHGLIADPHHATADDDDSVVLARDPVFAVPHAPALRAPALWREIVLPEPEVGLRTASASFIERLIHAPPRAPSLLRGPPTPSLL
ncbi:MAG TPA: hypothetical protein VFV95_03260 [Vicinamibacterales bacterium]|nr:hypothetical protein [Vicinamibacterales bacterium]